MVNQKSTKLSDTKRIIQILVIGVISLFYSCNSKNEEVNNKPNIVYILADDMGYGDLSSLNPDSGIITPHMDNIVENGIYFSDAHSNSSVCTPTRYGILTGRNAWKSSLKSGVLSGYHPPLIESNRTTVASFLQDNGYHTACIGKWHLGLGWESKLPGEPIRLPEKGLLVKDNNVDFSKTAMGPNELGFGYSYIIPSSLDIPPYLYIENGKPTALPTTNFKGRKQSVYGRGVAIRPGIMDPNFDFEDVLPHFTRKAITYIEEQTDKENPFFLYFPLTAPHTPWLPTEEVTGTSDAGRYGDFVKMVDNTVGEIVKSLKKSGQLENTLIIVTSDNGSHWKESDKELYPHRANHIYRGQKADIYEGGHHIPFIAQWPGKIKAGSHSKQIMSTTDLLATVAGIINQPIDEEAGEDSYNLWPAYLGEDTEVIRDFTIHHSLHGYFSIRKGKWKLTPHLGSGGFSKPVRNDSSEVGFEGTLYDMEKDPTETVNLYNQEIEIREELLAILKREQQSY